ncbi:MAG: M23 family metallopeptidase [Ferruginibacter sp.]
MNIVILSDHCKKTSLIILKIMAFNPKVFYTIVALLFLCQHSFSQSFPEKNYPQQYFQWPVGTAVGIVANFGELRPNHYHMGLDCRTDQKVNVPVYAAAEGYIARVKIEPFGFGRSITINHPNGLSTLYAHLNLFAPELEKYITDQQYKLQQWDVTIAVPEKLFPVSKGDPIAYSGNTGGSQGPHTHFEIRDTKTDKVLNPLLFGFPIPDTIPPNIIRLAIYDRRYSTYEQIPKIYSLKKIKGIYQPVTAIIPVSTDKLSFAITAFDRYTGSTNQNGIYKALLYDNGNAICGFEMDSISYDETRYLNAHIDYKTRSNGGPFLEHLSRLPGYINGIYKTDDSDGVIFLEDTTVHLIKILVTDANGNNSTLEFYVKINAVVEKNIVANRSIVFYPGYVNVFENADICFYLPENCIYDSFHFTYNEVVPASGKRIYQLHNTSVPLQTYFPVSIRADFSTNDTGRIVMKRSSGSKEDYKKAVYENGWYRASFREFGNFQLMVDSIPPAVTPLGFKEGMKTSKLSRIKFAVIDNTEEIKKFTALLDGNWLRFSNDKGRNFIYEFDEHCSSGEHELIIIAEDQVGNKTEKRYHFTR